MKTLLIIAGITLLILGITWGNLIGILLGGGALIGVFVWGYFFNQKDPKDIKISDQKLRRIIYWGIAIFLIACISIVLRFYFEL